MLDAVETLVEHPEMLEDLDPDDVAELINTAFDMLADRRGEHWRLRDRERVRLAKFMHKLAMKYGIDWLGKFVPEFMTVLLLYTTIASRLNQDKALQKDKAA